MVRKQRKSKNKTKENKGKELLKENSNSNTNSQNSILSQSTSQSSKKDSNSSSYILPWSKVQSKTNPSPRSFHTCCLSPNNFIYLIGGDNGQSFFRDVWAFDVKAKRWDCIVKDDINNSLYRGVNESFSGRSGHTCVYYDNALWIFGGRIKQSYLGDLIRFDLAKKSWTTIQTNYVSPRAAHTAIVSNNKMYVFGGVTSSLNNNDLEYLQSFIYFDFKTNTWTEIESTGDIPRARAGHGMTITDDDMIYIWGGRYGSSIYNDLIKFNLKLSKWEKVKIQNKSPKARAGLTLNYISGTKYLLLYGGVNWKVCFSDLWIFDYETNEWRQVLQTLDSQGDPQYSVIDSRGWHRMVECGSILFLFGGAKEKEVSNEAFILNIEKLLENNKPESPQPSSPVLHIKTNFVNSVSSVTSDKRDLSATTPDSGFKSISNFSVSAKISLDGEIRRFSLSYMFDAMIESLIAEYNFSNLSEITLHYTDDDNDKIAIKTASDWKECIDFFESTKKIMRLELNRVENTKDDPYSGIYFPSRNQPVSTPKTTMSQRNKFYWQKGQIIGEGAFGKVFLAINLIDKFFMAVKQIKITTPQMKENTMSEILLMKDLSHENIVRYLGVEFDDKEQLLYIFMELVQGGSLLHLLEKFDSFSESLVRYYTKQMLEGLRYLHDKRIIHRDIKAANILISTEGVAKLADFGHSKRINEDSIAFSSGLKGTPLWMAPEVLKGKKQNEFSDIWSLGCVIIEMSTGKPPWSEILEQNSNAHPMRIMNIISKQKGHPKYPDNFSNEGKDFLRLCFEMKTSVSELLKHPFVKEDLSFNHSIPLHINEERFESKETTYTPLSNYNNLQTYDELSDIESDDSSSDEEEIEDMDEDMDAEIDDENDEDFDEEDGEEDESDRILGEMIADKRSDIEDGDSVLTKQMEAIKRVRNSKEIQKVSESPSQHQVAQSQQQITSLLKEQEIALEANMKATQMLGERTLRVRQRQDKQRLR